MLDQRSVGADELLGTVVGGDRDELGPAWTMWLLWLERLRQEHRTVGRQRRTRPVIVRDTTPEVLEMTARAVIGPASRRHGDSDHRE